MKQLKSSPDKLPAEGNSKVKNPIRLFKVLSLRKVINKIQIIAAVTITISMIDFCRERYII